MNRLLTLCLLAVCASLHAQTPADFPFQFVDADGNIVPDGSVITVTQVEDDGFGPQMSVPLRVRNVSGQKAAVSMYETIDDKPNGAWQTCAFGSCVVLQGTNYSSKSIVEANYEADIQTEWLPDEGAYAQWAATLQIQVFNTEMKQTFLGYVEQPGNDVIGLGPKVTVRFRYADPAAIQTVTTQRTAHTCFDMQGRSITLPVKKGIYIVDGRKRIVR